MLNYMNTVWKLHYNYAISFCGIVTSVLFGHILHSVVGLECIFGISIS